MVDEEVGLGSRVGASAIRRGGASGVGASICIGSCAFVIISLGTGVSVGSPTAALNLPSKSILLPNSSMPNSTKTTRASAPHRTALHLRLQPSGLRQALICAVLMATTVETSRYARAVSISPRRWSSWSIRARAVRYCSSACSRSPCFSNLLARSSMTSTSASLVSIRRITISRIRRRGHFFGGSRTLSAGPLSTEDIIPFADGIADCRCF